MRKLIVAATAALTVLGGAASAQESIKIGYIDPLSGGGASVGEGGCHPAPCQRQAASGGGPLATADACTRGTRPR